MLKSSDFVAARTFSTKRSGQVAVGVLRPQKDGLSLLGAHLLVEELGSRRHAPLRLIRPRVADELLASRDGCRFFADNGCMTFPTSLVVAYGAPGLPVCENVTYIASRSSITFLSGSGCTLCPGAVVFAEVAAGDFRKQGRSIAVEPKHAMIAMVPEQSGWHPLGAGLLPIAGLGANPFDEDARYIWRFPGKIVTALYRGTAEPGGVRCILLDRSPFEKHSVVVELPADSTGPPPDTQNTVF